MQQSILCNKLEDIEKQIKEINQTIKTFTGTINPPHRPLKDIDVSGIIELVESGVSARVVAKRAGGHQYGYNQTRKGRVWIY